MLCKERCPVCGEQCFGPSAHERTRTAPRQIPTLHQCRVHVWGTVGNQVEVEGARYREIRKELMRELGMEQERAAGRLRRAIGELPTGG